MLKGPTYCSLTQFNASRSQPKSRSGERTSAQARTISPVTIRSVFLLISVRTASFRFRVEVITPLLIDGFAVRRMMTDGVALR